VEQESNELGLFEKLKATKKETFKELKYLLHLQQSVFLFFSCYFFDAYRNVEFNGTI
jgi:hypothetical protein